MNTQNDILLMDFFKSAPQIAVFDNIDPVYYQQEMRDEWGEISHLSETLAQIYRECDFQAA